MSPQLVTHQILTTVVCFCDLLAGFITQWHNRITFLLCGCQGSVCKELDNNVTRPWLPRGFCESHRLNDDLLSSFARLSASAGLCNVVVGVLMSPCLDCQSPVEDRFPRVGSPGERSFYGYSSLFMPRLFSRRLLLVSDAVYETGASILCFVNKTLLAHTATHPLLWLFLATAELSSQMEKQLISVDTSSFSGPSQSLPSQECCCLFPVL